MIKYGVFGILILLLAAAVTATFRPAQTPESADAQAQTAFVPDRSAALETRVAELEDRLLSESAMRVRLESRLLVLEHQNREMVALMESQVQQSQANARLAESGVNPRDNPLANSAPRDGDSRALSAMVEGGFTEFRAQEILEQVNSLRQAAFDAAIGSGERPDPQLLMAEVSDQLRLSMGDYDYERYLSATGQPTSVPIRAVEESSSASLAGLQAGDEIVRYAGQRVFNFTDLTKLTQGSSAGSTVLVEVVRQGSPLSVSVPAGTLGVSIDRRGAVPPGR